MQLTLNLHQIGYDQENVLNYFLDLCQSVEFDEVPKNWKVQADASIILATNKLYGKVKLISKKNDGYIIFKHI